MLELALLVVPLLVAGGFIRWDRRRRRDLVWAGVTPGEKPLDAQSQTRRYGARGDDNVTVRFTPPDEMTPGMAGTIIDGTADRRDVAATLIDLAVRDFLVLRPLERPGTGTHEAKPRWQVVRTEKRATGLERHEQEILEQLRGAGAGTFVDELPPALFGGTQAALREDAVAHGWFDPPRRLTPRRLALGFAALAAVPAALALTSPSSVALALAAGIGAGALLLAFFRAAPATRTAPGAATRAQALGFQRYLATAEARQIRLEEAQDLFSRFLPWAIAFGVADRWAKTFAEAAAIGHASGVDVLFDLHWIDGLGTLVPGGDGSEALAALDLGGGEIFTTIDQLTGTLSESTGLLGDALGGITDSLGSIAESVGDLVGDVFDGFDF